ncbi:hypothetical protein IM543_06315 [Massilia sp. UMI-21]|nr:hypothetical protein IM543_06315 [Massilia sp. UMI-21]
MDFSGLIGKYPINRLLTEQERAHQLKQDRPLGLIPRYQLSVIKMNSTFLETVDKWYGWKGAATAITSAVLLVISGVFGWMGLKLFLQGMGILQSTLDADVATANGIGMLFVFCLFGWGVLCLLRKESFAYTHYPMRFNRKNRKVYFFRTNGTVLAYPWEDLFFTLGTIPASNLWEVRAHILDADRKTVRETFALSYSGTLEAAEFVGNTANFFSEDFVRAHWEFVRRYMEEGPQEILSQIQFCMPIDQKRENVSLGFERIFANFAGAPALLYFAMFPFCFVVSVFRIFAIQTSKIPFWPEEVEASCAIEPDDPYAIQGAADGGRVAVYPEAALAAGVGFSTL